MSTFTGTAAAPGVQPRVVKTGGLFPITCEFTKGSGNLADTDVILLAKVANQVTIHSFAAMFLGGADTQNIVTLRVGSTATVRLNLFAIAAPPQPRAHAMVEPRLCAPRRTSMALSPPQQGH